MEDSTEVFIKERKYLMNVSVATLQFYRDTFISVRKHGDFTEAGLKRWVWSRIEPEPNRVVVRARGMFTLLDLAGNIALIRAHLEGTRELDAFPEPLLIEAHAPEEKEFVLILEGFDALTPDAAGNLNTNVIFVDHHGDEHVVPAKFRPRA